MTLWLDESLEDYEEIFQLHYKRTNYTFDPESLNHVLLRGIREDLMDTLDIVNIISSGNIY